jgi:hypothetical protein
VGVIEPGGELDLAQEALGPQGRGQLRPQHLDRDRAVMLLVLGEIDRGHPTAADLPLDRVAVGEGLRDAFQQIGHQVTSTGCALL